MAKMTEFMYALEAAEYLGVHHNTHHKWAACGDIPMQLNPMNGNGLFKRSEFDKLLKNVAQLVKTI